MIKNKRFSKVGVIGFGGYVPSLRLKVEEIAKHREKNGGEVRASLGVEQKAVGERDEDTVSLAVEAGKRALLRSKIKPKDLGSVLVGSESHPYAVKPSGSIVAEILGVGREYITVDLEFACKAGTTGMILIAGLIEAGIIECGMAIGADVAQSQPGNALEYTAGAGAGAVILGSRKYQWLAKLERVFSFNSDTPDFWRREGEEYPQHAGRFTGEPGYFKHVIEGTELFLKKGREEIKNFDHVVLHMPNGKFPKLAGKKLRISEKQLETGFVVEKIGNPYSASAMMGLVKVFEEGQAGERVLMTSYGSGAGSDSFSFEILKKTLRDKKIDLKTQINTFEDISYLEYLKIKGVV